MASKKFEKDSKEFQMFTEFWKMTQAFWIMEDNDDYWKSLISACESFQKRYGTDFAARLAGALASSKDFDWKEKKDAEKKNLRS